VHAPRYERHANPGPQRGGGQLFADSSILRIKLQNQVAHLNETPVGVPLEASWSIEEPSWLRAPSPW
jgi:hypothetical protein